MKGIALAWDAKVNPKAEVRLPRVIYDSLRIDIVKAYRVSGGLSEIEVWRRGKNIARGGAARASVPYNPAFPRCTPAMATDGIIQQEEDAKGYWLLPTAEPGWIEVDLSTG
jgi:hypothetical protein